MRDRQAAAARRVRAIIESLDREGATAVATGGSAHDFRTVTISTGEAEALRGWVVRENAVHTLEIGLAFVDGNHRFDAVFVDLYYLGRLVRRGGIIILDDTDLPGVTRAASFYIKNLGRTVEATAPAGDEHGWTVLRTAEDEDTRDFRHFVEL